MGYLGGLAQKALAERKMNPDARFDMAAYWFRGLERIKNLPDSAEQSHHWNDKRIVAAVGANLSAGSVTVSCALQ